MFQGQIWGGMSANTGVFIQSAIDIEETDRDLNGQWRIFGKMGAGYSGSRHRGEILTNAYGCFPDNGPHKVWPDLDGE